MILHKAGRSELAVDGVGTYPAGAVSWIHRNVSLSAGTDMVVIRAWDTSANYGDRALTLTVNASKPSLKVSMPANHSSLGLPVNLEASATPSSGQRISETGSRWTVKQRTNGSATDSINTSLEMSTGKHSVVVRPWDTSGNYGDQAITLTLT